MFTHTYVKEKKRAKEWIKDMIYESGQYTKQPRVESLFSCLTGIDPMSSK